MPIDPEILRLANEVADSAPAMIDESILRSADKAVRYPKTEEAKIKSFAKRRLEASPLPNLTAVSSGIGSGVAAPLTRIFSPEVADRIQNINTAIQEEASRRDVDNTIFSPAVARAGRGVASTLPTMALAAFAGPGAVIGTAALQEQDRALTEAKNAGLEGGEALGYSLAQGGIEGGIAGLFQMAGMGGVEKALPGMLRNSAGVGLRQGLKKAGVTAIQELPEEVLTELSHNVAAKLSGVDQNAMDWETMKGTIQDTVLQTLLTVGVVEAPGVARSYRSGDIARIRNEIVSAARSGAKVSRETWRKWGFSPVAGKSWKDRVARVKEIAGQITGRRAEKAGVAAGQAAQSYGDAVASLEPQEVEAPAATEDQPPETAFPRTAEMRAQSPVRPEVMESSAAVLRSPIEHDFPVEMESTGEDIGSREVVRQLQQIWGTPLRIGRMQGHKDARGIYKIRPQVARLASGHEGAAAVAIHEAIGHHMDTTTDVLKSAPPEARDEVGKLDYDQEKKRDFEGFAEFTRAYLTGASQVHPGGVDLAAETPKFLAHFEAWLAKNPEVAEKFKASREPIRSFIHAGAAGRVRGQISRTGKDETAEPPILQRVKGWAEFLYTRIKDEGRPVSKFTKEAIEKGYDPGGSATPFEMYNALRNAGSHFAQNAIENGVFTVTGTPTKIGPSLYEVMEGIEPGEDSANFSAWAYARHSVESWRKGKNPGITLADAKEAMSRLYDPRYEKAADKLTEFNNALIAVLADAGVITSDEAKQIVTAYEHYIPLERAKEGATGSGGRRMLDLSPAIKGRKGSGLQIIDPVESTLARAVRFYERATKQLVLNRMLEVAGSVDGLGGWVEEVPPKVLATTFKLSEIAEQLGEDAGPLLDVLDPSTALTIWRPDMAKVHGVPIYRVVRNGEVKFYQMAPELGEALGGLDSVQHLDPVTHIMRNLTGFLKIGATRANPDFIASNALRDYQTFLLQGEAGISGAFDPVRYAAAYITHELRRAAGEPGVAEVALFKKMGGELSTFAGLDRSRLASGKKRALRGSQGRVETALNVLGVTEVAPRIAEFSKILEDEGWLEKVRAGDTPPIDVLVKAINAAHDVTIDFRRMGKWGRYLNYYIPFFNARAEGLDKFIRTFKDNPQRATLRAAYAIALPSLVYWWLRHDDDDYKERPEWQDNYYVLKDGEGNPAWRIPKPQEWGTIGSGVERMLDAMYDRDPDAVGRWFGQVFRAVNPGGLPAGVTPAYEAMSNYDTFRGRDIESSTVRKLEPQDRTYEYTTSVAKAVANTIHSASGGKVRLSPIMMDHIANGLSGGLFGKISAPVEKVFRGGEWSVSDVPGFKGVSLRKDYARSIDDFYEAREAINQRVESIKHRAGKVSQEDLDVKLRLSYAEEIISDMRKAAKNLPANERVEVEKAMIGLARAALGRQPLDRYPNPISDPGILPDSVRGVVADYLAKKAITAAGESESSVMARKYLRRMGADEQTAADLAYDRLRSQGVRSKTAADRISAMGFGGD